MDYEINVLKAKLTGYGATLNYLYSKAESIEERIEYGKEIDAVNEKIATLISIEHHIQEID